MSEPRLAQDGDRAGDRAWLVESKLRGSNFEESMNQMQVTPIQTGFKFERVNNWGGFINRKVFFVNFTKNYELIKLDFE